MFRILLLLVVTTSSLFALSIEVHPTGKSAISAALVESRPGDTLIIYPGEYKENIIVTTEVALVAKEPLKAILKGDSRGSVVTLNSGSSINGFIIKGGNKGVSANYGNAHIDNCIITQNRASGIFALSQFPPISNTIISYNGTGIMAQSINNTIILNHVTIANNSTYGLNFPQSRGVQISQSIFYKNEIAHIEGTLDNITFTNTLLYPKQKALRKATIIFKEPSFSREKSERALYKLTPTSPGVGTAEENRNIGAQF